MQTLALEDWKKVELKVGQIKSVERVENADKLYKILVDLGEENLRQIVSGIVPFYTVEELLDRKIIVVANLAPATIRGVESNGMLLAASENGNAKLLSVPDDVMPGTIIR